MNNYALKTVTAPTDEPIDSTEAKLHMAIDDSTFDTLINDYIKAARMYIEANTNRQICTATYDLILDKFPGASGSICLPKGQLQSITSVKYIDTDGVEQTLAASNYSVTDSREPAILDPAYNKTWPATRLQRDAVTVRFVCGYGDSSVTPEGIKQAALMMVGHYFEHREAVAFNSVPSVVPLAVDSLLSVYKLGDAFQWYEAAR